MSNSYEIDIEVETSYMAEHSEPDEDRYVFAYTITLVNKGSISATLLSRRWIITDSENHTEEVEGDGVVGEQPKLKPGEQFSYSSGAIIETPVGAMQGKYNMQADNGNSFDAPIAPFTLAVPGILH